MPADRYSRQIILPQIGKEGQRRLSAARVLAVGCGGTGAAIAQYLVRAGIGKLTILDYLGNLMYSVDLPAGVGEDWNGAMAAPTLANIDTDPDLEVVLVTANSGVVAYDLPGSAQARILWGTGRGNYKRSGSK